MSTVTVLTPHGRRQVVKVDPNKTVLWVSFDELRKYFAICIVIESFVYF